MLTTPIIDRAVENLTRDFRITVRLGLVPLVLAIGFALAMSVPAIRQFRNFLIAGPSYRQPTIDIGNWAVLMVVIGILVVFAVGFRVAVRWHRYSFGMSLKTQKGFWRGLKYAFASVGISFVILFVFALINFPLSALLGTKDTLAVADFSGLQGPVDFVVRGVVTLGFYYFLFRWSPVLVRIAVDGPSFASFERTLHFRREILHISAIYTAAFFLWDMAGGISLPLFLDVPVNLGFTWFAFMISISVLTEIYREVLTDEEQLAMLTNGSSAVEDFELSQESTLE